MLLIWKIHLGKEATNHAQRITVSWQWRPASALARALIFNEFLCSKIQSRLDFTIKLGFIHQIHDHVHKGARSRDNEFIFSNKALKTLQNTQGCSQISRLSSTPTYKPLSTGKPTSLIRAMDKSKANNTIALRSRCHRQDQSQLFEGHKKDPIIELRNIGKSHPGIDNVIVVQFFICRSREMSQIWCLNCKRIKRWPM